MPHGFVELFEHPIEGRAHAVCHVASTLCQAYVQFVAHGIVFGQVGMFVLCGGDAVIEDRLSLLRSH